jgi:DNA polymerase-3 subunit delta
MITILVGNDNYSIAKQITAYKAEINPDWQQFNFHRFNFEKIEEAIAVCRTVIFGDGKKLVVVENCDFKVFSEEMLRPLIDLPASTHLILTSTSIDKRLKGCKQLLRFARLQQFELISSWRTDLIASEIATRSKQFDLKLSKPVVNYLAKAIGNDNVRIDAELQKLAIYANGKALAEQTVKGLIPTTTQTSLELADAIRLGKVERAIELLEELNSRGEYPLKIISTLQTQFRTWLIVKAAIEKGIKSDIEIARLAQIGNLKRIYYLRREVQNLKLSVLFTVITNLLDLEVALKSGMKVQEMLPILLRTLQLFSSSFPSSRKRS